MMSRIAVTGSRPEISPSIASAAVPRDERGSRSFLIGFLVSTGIVLGLVAAFNLVMDPYSSQDGSLFPGVYEFGTSRIGKGELLNRYSGGTVYIGNSRVMLGVRGRDPMTGGDACNLGVAGASLGEIREILRATIQKPTVRRILVFVDFDMFHDDFGFRESFAMSRFAPGRSAIEHSFDLALNYHTLLDSFEKLRLMNKGRLPEYSAFGCPLPERMTAKEPPAQRYRTILGNAYLQGKCSTPIHYSPRTVESLRPLIQEAGRRSIDLTFVINPLHATQFEAVWRSQSWDRYQAWTHDLVRVIHEEGRQRVTLWDFAGHNRYTTEPLVHTDGQSAGELKWFWEPSHYRCELGDLMLKRVEGDPDADPAFGTQLTPDNVTDRLARLDAGHGAWTLGARGDLALIAQIAGDEQAPPAPGVSQVAEQQDGTTTSRGLSR